MYGNVLYSGETELDHAHLSIYCLVLFSILLN